MDGGGSWREVGLKKLEPLSNSTLVVGVQICIIIDVCSVHNIYVPIYIYLRCRFVLTLQI